MTDWGFMVLGRIIAKGHALPKHILVALFFLVFTLGGCGGGSSYRYDPGKAPAPADVAATPGNELITVNWTPSSTAKTYNIYYVAEGPGITTVTKTNSTMVNVSFNSHSIQNLQNGTTYYIMVVPVNKNGEGDSSDVVSATPGGFVTGDLAGTWSVLTLVSGTGAGWMRGTASIAADGVATMSSFESSAASPAPGGYTMSVLADGQVLQSGANPLPQFQGYLSSRKDMIIGTYTPAAGSAAITIYMKRNPAVTFNIDDLRGQVNDGNGPTRFAYHQIAAGANNEWEYANAKIGQQGQFIGSDFKDTTYWDYSTPHYKIAPRYESLWKVSSFGISSTGVVNEYYNLSYGTYYGSTYAQGESIFTGIMSADKTVIAGVGSKRDAGGNTCYVLRIIELCFKPADETIPTYTLDDLAGAYRFVKLNSSSPNWAHGRMLISASGAATFPSYTDSIVGPAISTDSFTFAKYPDAIAPTKRWPDFANFTTPVLDGWSRYHDASGNPIHTYYDFWSFGYRPPNPPRALILGNDYYNEHGTLSYNKDLFVMTRTEANGGYAMIIGVK